MEGSDEFSLALGEIVGRGIFTQEFGVPGNRGLLHFYTSRMFSELEIHTREEEVSPGGSVTLKGVWTLSSGKKTAMVPQKKSAGNTPIDK